MTSTSRTYYIPIVFHVIHSTDGVTGKLSKELIRCQVRALSQDFNGVPHGISGYYVSDANAKIEFFLARKKPDGSDTDGIDYIANDTLYTGLGLRTPGDSIATKRYNWDPTRYLNIYTSGTQRDGYTNWAWNGSPYNCPGSYFDGVRLWYRNVGRPAATLGFIGRPAVHEVGHYLGLYHDFSCRLCPPSPACYSRGDRICDTPLDDGSVTAPDCNNHLCGQVGADPHNYMSPPRDDNCINKFTGEQIARMRCTLVNSRPNLHQLSPIDETSMTLTVTQLCSGSTARIKFDITWQTPTVTSGPDSLKLYLEPPAGTCPATECPDASTTRKASATSGGTTHHVIWEGDCTPGNWRYVVKSQNGSTIIQGFCRYYVVTGCVSCGGGCHPPCELE